MAIAVHDGAASLPTFLPRGLPSTRTLIDGRREAGEQLFEVHDRYTEAPIAQVHAATQAQVAQAVRVARKACLRPRRLTSGRAFCAGLRS